MYKLTKIATVYNILLQEPADRPALICGHCMSCVGLFYYLQYGQYEFVYQKFLQEYSCDVCTLRIPSYIVHE